MNNEEQKQNTETQLKKSWVNRHPVATVIILVAGFLIIIGAFSESQNNSSTSAPVATQPSGPCVNFDKTTATSSINYAELDKDPLAYNGTNAVYTGQVVQIEQNPDGSGIMRLAITKEDYGYSLSDIVYVTYSGGTNAVDNDIVTVYGQMTGAETYTSEANYQITIPSMVACEIDDQTQAQPAAQKPSTSVTTPQPPTPSAAPVQAPALAAPLVATPAPQTPPPASATWHTVLTYNGPDTPDTAPFTMQGSQWRVTYSCSLNGTSDPAASGFLGSISSVSDGDPVDDFNPHCPQSSNISYSYDNPPGQYALQVTSVNASYSITIEDYY